MANLFVMEGMSVMPNPETLLISPFSEIWERDLSKNKETAIKELTYIEFMSSAKASNPFREAPLKEKSEIVIKEIFRDVDWSPDDLVNEGIEYINKAQTEMSFTYRYWTSNLKLLEKLIAWADKFSMNQVNFKTGAPIYKPKDVTDAVEKAERVMAALLSLRKKVEAELFENVKNKGGKEISEFAKKHALNLEEDDYFVEGEDN